MTQTSAGDGLGSPVFEFSTCTPIGLKPSRIVLWIELYFDTKVIMYGRYGEGQICHQGSGLSYIVRGEAGHFQYGLRTCLLLVHLIPQARWKKCFLDTNIVTSNTREELVHHNVSLSHVVLCQMTKKKKSNKQCLRHPNMLINMLVCNFPGANCKYAVRDCLAG